MLTAGCAVAVLVCAIVRLRDPARIQGRLPLVIALFGVMTPAVTGHAGTSPDHQLSVITVALHAGAAALWVGGLGALLAAAGSATAPCWTRCCPGSRSWPASAWSRSGSPGWPTRCSGWAPGRPWSATPYGWLVLAKTGCLVLLAGLGGLARQRLQAGRLPVLRWAGIEVALMAVTLGLAAALTQTAWVAVGRQGWRAVGLQQAEPDLADRRVRGDGVPEPGHRHLADDATVAACTISATSCPTNVAPTSTSRARSTTSRAAPSYPSACSVEPPTAIGRSTTRTSSPASRARASVSPTAATSGSVNTTCGTAAWSAVAACSPHGAVSTGCPAARAAIAAPAMRASYLPWWVSGARPVTSPAA